MRTTDGGEPSHLAIILLEDVDVGEQTVHFRTFVQQPTHSSTIRGGGRARDVIGGRLVQTQFVST